MKIGLNNQQKLVITLFLCTVVLCVVISVLNLTVLDKTEKLRQQNVQLQNQYDTLQIYVINKEKYESETSENIQMSKNVANKYIGGVSKKTVLNKFDDFFEEYAIKSSSLSLSDAEIDNEIYLTDFDDKDLSLVLQHTPINIAYSMKYSKLKEFIPELVNPDENMGVDSISIAFDESTGDITGTLALNWYSIDGYKDSEESYKEYNLGVDSLFGDTPVETEVVDEEVTE